MIVNVQPKAGAGMRIEDTFYIEVVLSSGQVLTLRELVQFSGWLNVSCDGTLTIHPRSASSANLSEF